MFNNSSSTEESRKIFRDLRETVCKLGIMKQWRPLMIETHHYSKRYALCFAGLAVVAPRGNIALDN